MMVHPAFRIRSGNPVIRRFLTIGAIAIFGFSIVSAQNATGITGLLSIPTARFQDDGTVLISAGHVNHRYSRYMEGLYDYRVLAGSVTFLPMVEAAFRFSIAQSGQPEALGDRMLMVRVRMISERGLRPAVVLGAHDFLRSSENETNQFHVVYAVVSKNLALAGMEWDVHLGFGTQAFDARQTQFNGVFGGVALTPPGLKDLELLAEYDTRVPAAGARYHLFNHVYITAGMQGFSVPLVALSVHTRL